MKIGMFVVFVPMLMPDVVFALSILHCPAAKTVIPPTDVLKLMASTPVPAEESISRDVPGPLPVPTSAIEKSWPEAELFSVNEQPPLVDETGIVDTKVKGPLLV